MDSKSSIIELKGIGEKTEKYFHKLNIETVGDLLDFFPRSYDIYEAPIPISDVEEGKIFTIKGRISGRIQAGGNRGLQVTTVQVHDESGSIKVIWYRMPFLKNTLKLNEDIILRGKVALKNKTLVMEHPEIFCPVQNYETKLHTMQPIYPLTAGLSNNTVIKAMKQSLEYIDRKKDIVPEDIRRKYELADYLYAVEEIHFPLDKQAYIHARERLVFDEFLLFTLAIRRSKDTKERSWNHFKITYKEKMDEVIERLPFKLTGAQTRVFNEIKEELTGEKVMSRLVQGDVGSGKTILAVLAMFMTGLNGYQSAIMAPTEVLARQHYETITKMVEEYELPLQASLLTGSMKAKEKRETYEKIRSGEAKIIIGTHALIQEKVEYSELALVITDEQHRFGVKQRENFSKKGEKPHILVMSATPIPRTLAIILYGDLDISVVDELPADRLPIKNCVVGEDYRDKAYSFMKKQVKSGRQCYVICPMVEESEAIEAENVIDYSKKLQQIFGEEIKVEYLHGKMKQAQKDEIMTRFAENKIHILVSTTVIEVGINVPNATVMMVENAERFGLAQLHQLRGRVGRGKYQSYCIFMTASKGKDTKKRLEILNKSNDGFYIANEDLKLRGPGDLFGITQSGLMNFKIADVFQDAKVLMEANAAADLIMKDDPMLIKEKNENLKNYMDEYLNREILETTL